MKLKLTSGLWYKVIFTNNLGLCPIGLGADGGGSIRLPSGVCGIVGAKGNFSLWNMQQLFFLCY